MTQFPASAIDVHQHVMPAQLVEILRQRTDPPRMRGWVLELRGEPEYLVDPEHHDLQTRAAQAAEDGLALALVSLSSALGVEQLPPEESQELIDAFHAGARELPAPFRPWASACLTEIDAGAVERALDDGCLGLQLPATALATAAGYEHVAPLLEVLAAHGRPLFIHPGPLAWDDRASEPLPEWWAPLVPYVQQMHAAWFAFRLYGRPAFPELRVCLALLAGLAPLHAERLAARGGGRRAVDKNVFLDVSSYGPRAIDAVVRVLGVDVLVNGSDRPYASPVLPELGDAFDAALRLTNPLRLFDLEEVINAPEVAAGAQSRAH